MVFGYVNQSILLSKYCEIYSSSTVTKVYYVEHNSSKQFVFKTNFGLLLIDNWYYYLFGVKLDLMIRFGLNFSYFCTIIYANKTLETDESRFDYWRNGRNW